MSRNEQMIVVYEDPSSHSIKKYTTAYTKEQEEFYFQKCLEKYGNRGKVRIVKSTYCFWKDSQSWIY